MREKLSDLFEDGATTREQRNGTATVPPIYVSQPRYDDMGAALDRLEISYDSLSSADVPRLEDAVVMINCGCGGYAEKARELDTFVSRGGSAIVSDLASPTIAELSDASFTGGGTGGTVEADIVDDELERLLGQPTAPITLTGGYDEPSRLPDRSSVYLRERDGGTPLAYSFPYGDGEFVFTAFHNHEQTSEVEEALFAFLLMVPIASVTDQTVTETYTGLVAVDDDDGQGRADSLGVVEPDTDDATADTTDDRAPGAPRTCSNCGQENDSGETFCADCGYRLDT